MRKITTLIVLALIALVTKAQLTDVHSCEQLDGTSLHSALVFNGTYLYGCAIGGGIRDTGTVFKLRVSDNNFTKITDLYDDKGMFGYDSPIIINNTLYGITYSGGTSNSSSFSEGVIYKVDLSNDNYTVVYNFISNTQNGTSPNSIVYDGNFIYGTCYVNYNNGTAGEGVLFKFDINTNTYTKLLDFDNVEGERPQKIISDGDYLYGITEYEGTNDAGTIFKYNKTTGDYSVIYSFEPQTGFKPTNIYMIGNYIYGTCKYGGSYWVSGSNNGYGVIFRINKNQPTDYTYLDFDNNIKGNHPEGIIDYNNELYGIAEAGGNNGYGTLFKIDYNLTNFTKLYDFDGTDGKYPQDNITLANNSLYGVTYYGGQNGLGNIFKYDLTTNSISFVNTKENINIYPSPASNNITISFNEIPDILKITDVTGKTVFSTNNTNNTMNINISDYQEGMYFVISTKNNKKQVKKFIKN